MKIFESLEQVNITEPTAVALGNFDGVHIGHQELIRRSVMTAKGDGLKSCVFTFSNHPRNFICGEGTVQNILYGDEKRRIIEAMGVEYLFDIPFTQEICTMDPIRYIDQLLIEKFGAKEIYCGFNYTFGYKGAGDVAVLMQEGLKRECGIHVVEPIKLDGQVVSSTLIRAAIEKGDMESVSRFLGRHYTLGGHVLMGNQLGRTIGFPTVNLELDAGMVGPANGVYVSFCTVDGVRYPSVTNVGVKPTIGTFGKNVETNIFNFSDDLYGEYIRVELVKHTRPEKKFCGVEELKEQIAKDVITAKAYHRQRGDL